MAPPWPLLQTEKAMSSSHEDLPFIQGIHSFIQKHLWSNCHMPGTIKKWAYSVDLEAKGPFLPYLKSREYMIEGSIAVN